MTQVKGEVGDGALDKGKGFCEGEQHVKGVILCRLIYMESSYHRKIWVCLHSHLCIHVKYI